MLIREKEATQIVESDDRPKKQVVPIELIQQAKQGDEKAFATLFTFYQDALFRFLAGLVGKDDAEDLLQDVFFKAWKALSEDQNILYFSAWLYRIAHNQAIDHLRRKKRFIWQALEEVSHEPECIIDQDLAHHLYQQSLIQQTLTKLSRQVPKKIYLCFLLFVVSECSKEETSETLCIGERTVLVYVSKARSIFCQIYKQLENNEKEEEKRLYGEGR